MCFEYRRQNFQCSNESKFSHLLTLRAEGADPPLPLTVSLTVKYLLFLRLRLKNIMLMLGDWKNPDIRIFLFFWIYMCVSEWIRINWNRMTNSSTDNKTFSLDPLFGLHTLNTSWLNCYLAGGSFSLNIALQAYVLRKFSFSYLLWP